MLGHPEVVERYGEQGDIGREELVGLMGGQRHGLELLGGALHFRRSHEGLCSERPHGGRYGFDSYVTTDYSVVRVSPLHSCSTMSARARLWEPSARMLASKRYRVMIPPGCM